MVAKCLNPACSAIFRTLRDGRLFVKELDDGYHAEDGGEHHHRLGYFWLCGSCCRSMTVIAEKGSVRLAALPATAACFRKAS